MVFVALTAGAEFESRFEIVKLLGQGATGAVYLMRDRSLDGAEVAVKVVHAHLLHDQKAIERILNEMLLTRKLNHRNILKVHECVAERQAAVFLVLEYVDGVTLAEVLRLAGAVSALSAAQILASVAAGLAHAHQEGIVHRDLKPENILISLDGEVKICDFGLAELAVGGPLGSELTTLGGTPRYMSPEQFLGKRPDFRSDLYSLGCIGYELVAGVPPVNESNLYRLAQAHIAGEIPPLPIMGSGVQKWYAQLIASLLVTDVEQRLTSAPKIQDSIREHIGPPRSVELAKLAYETRAAGRRKGIAHRAARLSRQVALTAALIVAVVLPAQIHESVRFRYAIAMCKVENLLRHELPVWRTALDLQIPFPGYDFIFELLEGKVKMKTKRAEREAINAWAYTSSWVDVPYVGADRKMRGSTPLMWLSAKGSERALGYLLANGADVNAQDVMGNTALHHVIGPTGYAQLVELLRHHPRLTILNRDGYAPLHVAILRGYIGMVETILRNAGTGAGELVAQRTGSGQSSYELADRLAPEQRELLQQVLQKYESNDLNHESVSQDKLFGEPPVDARGAS